MDKIYVINFPTEPRRFVFAKRFFYTCTMKKNIIFGLLILFGCKDQGEKKAKEDLQALNTILPTANWRMIDGTDTSYIYFSRQTDNSYKISQFKLLKGDSSMTDQSNISISGNSVTWTRDKKLLVLETVDDNKSTWKQDDSNENFLLSKLDDSTLLIDLTSKQITLKKMLPLSSFLVRAKYDYEHGTKLLEAPELKPRRKSLAK